VVDRLESVPTDAADRPTRRIAIDAIALSD
jgi:hypothetical protein